MGPDNRNWVAKLHKNDKYSDCSLICQGRTFKVHRVVCSQSPVIDAAFAGEFKEGKSKILTVNEFDIPSIERLIQYLYTNDYNLSGIGNSIGDSARSHLQMVVVADYYRLAGLGKLARGRLEMLMMHNWSPQVFCDILELAWAHCGDTEMMAVLINLGTPKLEQLAKMPKFQGLIGAHSLGLEFILAIVRERGKPKQPPVIFAKR